MARIGGFGRCLIFRAKQDHSMIVKADGTTAAVDKADATLVLGSNSGNDILEQTDFTYNDDGSVTLKFAQTKFDEDFTTFLNIACPRTSSSGSSEPEEKYDEAGRKIGGSTGSGTEPAFLVMSYGAEGDDGEIPVSLHLGFFKKSSGSRSYKKGSWVAPGLDFQSVACKQANGTTIGKDLFDDAIVVIPALDLTFPEGSHELIRWCSPAS